MEDRRPLLIGDRKLGDEQLARRAREGSREAFCELVLRFQARVRAYLGRFARDRDVVDDLAQETFLTAYRSFSSYREEVPLAVWLLRIGKNRALYHLRGEQHRHAREAESLEFALAGWRTEMVDSEETVTRHERELSALEKCMQGLPKGNLDLVNDYYFKGRSAAEIGRGKGSSEGAIWVAMLRIREALQRCVQSRLAEMDAS